MDDGGDGGQSRVCSCTKINVQVKCRKSGEMREPKGQADEMRCLNRPLQAKTDGVGLFSRA